MTVTGLRERRRRETEREIAAAALDLFEQRGVDATTVDDIAEAAGVSPRTVFRYFERKEDAALVAHQDVLDLVCADLPELDPASPLIGQLEQRWRTILTSFDNGRSPIGQQLLRLWTLMAAEPALRTAALRRDEELTHQLVAEIHRTFGLDADDVRPRTVVEVVAAVARVSLHTWAAAREAGRDLDLVTTYAAALRAVQQPDL